MIRAGETESAVTVTPQTLVVHSAHGVQIPIDAITKVELKDSIPKVGRKVSGYNSFSCVKKGQFKLAGVGVARIYIFTRAGPYLHISTGGELIVIAMSDPAQTRSLYEQILSHRQ